MRHINFVQFNGTKRLFCVLAIGLVIYIYNSRDFLKFETISFESESTVNIPLTLPERKIIRTHRKIIVPKNKFVLQWGKSDLDVKRMKGCSYTNCVFTNDKKYIANFSDFDAIIFNVKDIDDLIQHQPEKRYSYQKYIFFSNEPAIKVPVCLSKFNDYFNWTFTYKLDSDLVWTYFSIYDLEGNVVGPSKEMHWPLYMNPVGEDIRKYLMYKSRTAAMLPTTCNRENHTNPFLKRVIFELKKLNLKLTTYGKCGKTPCLKINKNCLNWLGRYYFFYFAFEDFFTEDYITDKLIKALDYFAVPVVFGGANYSRFLPPGSYINARELGPERLAQTLKKIISNPLQYIDYHRWRNHFVYNTNVRDPHCEICKALNNDDMMRLSVHHNFTNWWNADSESCVKL